MANDSKSLYEDSVHQKRNERKGRRRQRKLLNYQHKIKSVSPKTPNQEKLFRAFADEKHVLLHGSAGTGKSYCALFLALNDLFDGQFDKILIIRSIVPTRDIGFLPGSVAEKIVLYEEPYEDIINDLLCDRSAYDDLKKREAIEFKCTSFLRGISWINTLVIVDEVQNCTWHEICSLVTRIGEGSKLLLIGDNDQNDLVQQKKVEIGGLEKAIKVCNNMKRFDVIEFGFEDVIRSELVKEFLMVKKRLGL